MSLKIQIIIKKGEIMTTIKERIAKNYIDYPLNKRTSTMILDFEEKYYIKIEQFAKDNNISMEEFIFMALIDGLEREDLTLSNKTGND